MSKLNELYITTTGDLVQVQDTDSSIMLEMDGYVSPALNGISNYKDGNTYHKKNCSC